MATLKKNQFLLFAILLVSLNAISQDTTKSFEVKRNEFKKYVNSVGDIKKLNKDLFGPTFMIGAESRDGFLLKTGINAYFIGPWLVHMHKLGISAGYIFSNEHTLLNADYEYTFFWILGYTYVFNSVGMNTNAIIGDGKFNLAVQPKIGLDIVYGNLYLGYNLHLIRNIDYYKNGFNVSLEMNPLLFLKKKSRKVISKILY